MKTFLVVLLSLFGAVSVVPSHANEKKVLIMLGAPGAGKGTQAGRLSEEHGIPQISTGDLFRYNLKNETEVGQKAKGYMDKGQLVPDGVVLEMLFERLERDDCKKGYILDGCPRTMDQAEALTKHFDKSDRVVALSLEVPDEVIVERLAGRLTCSGCSAPYHVTAAPPKKEGVCDRCGEKLVQRKDDSESVIRERLAVFHEQTEPLKAYYQEQGKLLLVDGTVSKEQTILQVDASLDKFFFSH